MFSIYTTFLINLIALYMQLYNICIKMSIKSKRPPCFDRWSLNTLMCRCLVIFNVCRLKGGCHLMPFFLVAAATATAATTIARYGISFLNIYYISACVFSFFSYSFENIITTASATTTSTHIYPSIIKYGICPINIICLHKIKGEIKFVK